MKKEIKRNNYRKKNSNAKNTIVGILCLICFAGIILWQPTPKLDGEPVTVVVKEDAKAYIYDYVGTDKAWLLKGTDTTIPAGTELKAVAECSTYEWAVEDNAGNRFAIKKTSVDGDVSGLKAIRDGYHHVYRGMTLNGRRLADICKEAGDYIYADVNAGKYYFRQIVLANGSDRYDGVLLTVDGNGIVTNTEPTNPARSNLYTVFPFFDRIISLNLLDKFVPFSADADLEVLESFSLKQVGSSILNFFISIVLLFAIIFASFIVIAFVIGVTFGAGNLVFNAIGHFTRLKNSVIYVMEYIYMIPCTYVILFSVLYFFNDFWVLVLPVVIGLLVWMFILVENYSVRGARCTKCRSLNTIDVEEITYLTGYDVEGMHGKSYKVGTTEDIDVVRVVEHKLVETHTDCSRCHHVEDFSSNHNDVGNWVKIETVACPKCGKHTLRASSVVIGSTAEYVTETYRHRGDVKYKGESLKTGNSVFESKDRETTYGHWRGDVLYDKDVYCTECDYSNTVEYRFEPDTSKQKISEEHYKTRWKPKNDIWG